MILQVSSLLRVSEELNLLRLDATFHIVSVARWKQKRRTPDSPSALQRRGDVYCKDSDKDLTGFSSDIITFSGFGPMNVVSCIV